MPPNTCQDAIVKHVRIWDTGRRWLVGNNVTLADIALFAYTHVADEAGYRLADFPAISAWVAGFKSLPCYAPITDPLTTTDESSSHSALEAAIAFKPSGTHATKVRRSVRPLVRAERHFKAET